MKILLLDIETTPLTAYAWGPKWETNLIEVTRYMHVLSYSAKWLDGKQITKGWPNYKGYKKGKFDDKKIVLDIWNLLDEADVVIAHNGRQYDIKVLNARFAFHKLTPPSNYRVVDTKIEAKKYFRLPSNKLDDIGDFFNVGRKIQHEGFPLWLGCMAGDNSSWKKMLDYNKQDVLLLEKAYLILRPWINNHPNVGIYSDREVCPKCGSEDIQFRGFARNATTIYRRAQCKSCGGWMRSTKNLSEHKPLVNA